MAEAHSTFSALEPIVMLLFLGVAAAVLSRGLGLSPIVGYLGVGMALGGSGLGLLEESATIDLMAELGVVFLLFDIGLHFSLRHLREQARDIFGFGPVQVLFCTAGIGAVAWVLGLPPLAALLVGGTLALSSTAVVVRIIAERHQQNCPVGLTATAILIFQDVAAIFLLILVNALGRDGSDLLPEIALTLVKALAAFAVAVVLARVLVRPLFDLIARSNNEEVFTATALLVALAAGMATGAIGLSFTLGAFLGGMVIAETPYRAILQAEIKPFRGLLLGFFFISVGLKLDLPALAQSWAAVLGIAAALMAAKVILNACASLVFRWSVPGSTQLGFLLAQGSEFAFVVLSLPAMLDLVGTTTASVLIASVALSLALTPTMAEVGRKLAGRLRQRRKKLDDPELIARELTAPILIVGMGEIGRTVADALTEFGIEYNAIERDQRRFAEANADGYSVTFGDSGDPRIWEPVSLGRRQIIALTAPDFEVSSGLTPTTRRLFPDLRRLAAIRDEADRERFEALGIVPVLDRGTPRGIEIAAALLAEWGVDPGAIDLWRRRQQERALAGSEEAVPQAA